MRHILENEKSYIRLYCIQCKYTVYIYMCVHAQYIFKSKSYFAKNKISINQTPNKREPCRGTIYVNC